MALVKTIKDRNTHDTIYPITKADAVYLNDNETTVEGALGDLSTISSIGDGTIAGAISSLNMNLDHNKLHPWVQLIDGIQYAPEGNHVFIRLNITTSVTTSFNTLATLPSGHRPSFNQYFRVMGSNGTGDITILVNTSGNIQAKTDSGTNTAINGFICIA